MILYFITIWKWVFSQVQLLLKYWTKPATAVLITGLVSDLTRSQSDLLAENALLRQQVIVLERQVKRPQFTNGDRLRLVLISHCTKFWKQAIHIVQPDTVLRWYREMFRLYWRKKSVGGQCKPKIAPETIQLIKQMAKENQL